MNTLYHWTINGHPSCRGMTTALMAIYRNGKLRQLNLSHDLLKISVCSHETREVLERAIETLHKYLPDARCEVREGECPDYAEQLSWAADQSEDA